MKRKKGKRKLLPRLLAVVVALGLLGAGVKLAAQKLPVEELFAALPFSGGVKSSDAGEPGAGEAELFTLLIDETDFITGEENEAMLTVLYTAGLEGDFTVLDENGEAVCEIANDGSGRGMATVSVPSNEDSCLRFRAVLEDRESNWVTCYVHPEITAEMVQRLAQVSSDLGEFAEGQQFVDPLGAEALKAVKEYLLSDSRVAAAWENDGAVLYATIDSLMGSYGMGAAWNSQSTSFGGSFADQEETYLAYMEDEDVSGRTLKSNETLTNKKFLYLSPLPEDRLMRTVKESYIDKERELADSVEGEVFYMEREQAWEQLETGAFADAGFLLMVTHGKRLERKDGTYMFCFAMGRMDTYEFETVFDGTRMNAGRLWGAYAAGRGQAEIEEDDGEYLRSRESYRLLYDYNILEPEAPQILFATTNYLESVLKDKVFDNTVVFFSICHSGVDAELLSLFMDHGAGAYIGSVPELGATEAYTTLCALSDVLGDGGTVGDVKKKVLDGAYDKEVMEWYNSVIVPAYEAASQAAGTTSSVGPADRKDIEEWHADNQIIFRVSASEKRRVNGTGTLTGSVADAEGNPAAEAKVTVYRWLDHGYEEAGSVFTDEKGQYELKETDFGLYGITAEKEIGESRLPCTGCTVTELLPDGEETEEIILSEPWAQVTVFADREYEKKAVADGYVIRDIAVPAVYIEGNEEATEKINESAAIREARESTQKEAEAMETGIRELIASGYSTPWGPLTAESDLWVQDAGATKQSVSIMMKQVSFYAASAHPTSVIICCNFDTATGERLMLADILEPDEDETEENGGEVREETSRERLAKVLEEAFLNMEDGQSLLDWGWTDVGSVVSGEFLDAEESLRERHWYLSSEGLHMMFDVYQIGPYAAGCVQVTVPREKLSGIIKDEYTPMSLEDAAGKGVPKLLKYTKLGEKNRYDEKLHVYGDLSRSFWAGFTDDTAYETRITSVYRLVFYANYMTSHDAVCLNDADSDTAKPEDGGTVTYFK